MFSRAKSIFGFSGKPPVFFLVTTIFFGVVFSQTDVFALDVGNGTAALRMAPVRDVFSLKKNGVAPRVQMPLEEDYLLTDIDENGVDLPPSQWDESKASNRNVRLTIYLILAFTLVGLAMIFGWHYYKKWRTRRRAQQHYEYMIKNKDWRKNVRI